MPEGKRPNFSPDTLTAIATAVQAWDERKGSGIAGYLRLVDSVVEAIDLVGADMEKES